MGAGGKKNRAPHVQPPPRTKAGDRHARPPHPGCGELPQCHDGPWVGNVLPDTAPQEPEVPEPVAPGRSATVRPGNGGSPAEKGDQRIGPVLEVRRQAPQSGPRLAARRRRQGRPEHGAWPGCLTVRVSPPRAGKRRLQPAQEVEEEEDKLPVQSLQGQVEHGIQNPLPVPPVSAVPGGEEVHKGPLPHLRIRVHRSLGRSSQDLLRGGILHESVSRSGVRRDLGAQSRSLSRMHLHLGAYQKAGLSTTPA